MEITNEDRFELSRLGRAIEYHVDALSVIPDFPENLVARNLHHKQLNEVLVRVKEIIDGK